MAVQKIKATEPAAAAAVDPYPPELRAAAAAREKAGKAYDDQFRKYLSALPDLPGDEFWVLVTVLRHLIKKAAAGENGRRAVDRACAEFFRLPLAGEEAKLAGTARVRYDLTDACRFAKSYGAYGAAADAAFDDAGAELGRGDDSYNDLLDALPLAGEAAYKKVLAARPRTEEELNELVRPLGPFWADFVLEGENYVETTLTRQARKYVASALGHVTEDDLDD